MSLPALEALPAGVRCARDYEGVARARLAAAARTYFEAHAGAGLTRAANAAAWDRIGLLPRVLRGHSTCETGIELLGRRWPTPLLVAPMALQRLAHPDGELGMALAAAMQGTGMVLSMQSSVPMEQVAAAVRHEPGRGPLWFQLSLLRDRGATLELVRRAEAAGFEALVLTVDAAVRAARPLQLPPGIESVHLAQHAQFESAPSWADVAWLRSRTGLPVVLKGVLHPDDARQAAALEIAALVVSNHGGRVLDGAAATAAVLPRVVDTTSGALPVLVDGGIRSGVDVLKALALGARAVLPGRIALYGLGAAGAAGAAHVLRLVVDELRLALLQSGAAAVAGLGAELLLG